MGYRCLHVTSQCHKQLSIYSQKKFSYRLKNVFHYTLNGFDDEGFSMYNEKYVIGRVKAIFMTSAWADQN